MWLKHPRSDKKDTMLTLSVLAFITVVLKVIFNGVSLELGDKVFSFGVVDATIIGALLTPTLGAYVIRKYTNSPDSTETKGD